MTCAYVPTSLDGVDGCLEGNDVSSTIAAKQEHSPDLLSFLQLLYPVYNLLHERTIPFDSFYRKYCGPVRTREIEV